MVVEPVVILPAINKRPRSDPGPIGFFRTRLYDGAKASLAYQLRHSSFASKPDPPSHPPSGLAWPQFQPRLQRPAGQRSPDTDSTPPAAVTPTVAPSPRTMGTTILGRPTHSRGPRYPVP